MSDFPPADDAALTPQESAVVRAVAEGIPLRTISEMDGTDGMSVEQISDTCERAVSIFSHPSALRQRMGYDDFRAAERLADHPSMWRSELPVAAQR